VVNDKQERETGNKESSYFFIFEVFPYLLRDFFSENEIGHFSGISYSIVDFKS
jgi:hypothetical protein